MRARLGLATIVLGLFVFACVRLLPWHSRPTPTVNSYVFRHNGFCVFERVWRRRVHVETDEITLVLHAGQERVDRRLEQQLANWGGVASLAVVSSHSDLETAKACLLKQLSTFHSDTLDRLDVHLLFPEVKTSLNTTSKPGISVDPYPANIARNVARLFADTKLLLLADLEHFFSAAFAVRMRNLARNWLPSRPKTVLVYRIFEVESTNFTKPLTKQELRELLQTGNARVFHAPFTNGHAIPKLAEWLARPEESTANLTVHFTHPYTTGTWEPQFVSQRSLPWHDETFPYPFKDNTVLRWEMCRAGFRFAVVHDGFMYHRGFKNKTSHQRQRRAQRAIANRSIQALQRFRWRMDKLYPETRKHCPELPRSTHR